MNFELIRNLEVQTPKFLVQLTNPRETATTLLSTQIQQGMALQHRSATAGENIVPEANEWHARNQELCQQLFDTDLVLRYYNRTLMTGFSIGTEKVDMTALLQQIEQRTDRLKAISGLPCFLPDPGHSLIPKSLLHANLEAVCWSRYLEKDYDGAVFEAYKQLEIHLRASAGINVAVAPTAVPLAREAFKNNTSGAAGPLTDIGVLPGEQDAIAHLFAGAFGAYRNTTGHRAISLTADEALRQILLASHLMIYIDGRVAAIASPSTISTP